MYVITAQEQKLIIRNAGFIHDYGITAIVIVTWG